MDARVKTLFLSHRLLISYIKSIGYDVGSEGVCLGAGLMALQAILALDMTTFNERLNDIVHIPVDDFPAIIKRAEDRRLDVHRASKARCLPIGENVTTTNIEALNAYEQSLVDVPAFFESTLNYQYIYQRLHLFNNPTSLPLQDPIVSSSLALSLKLGSAFDSLIEIDSFSGIYTKSELQKLLASLRKSVKLLRKHGVVSSIPVTFILDNTMHAIMLAYDAEHDCWYYFDVNKMPIHTFAHKDITLVVDQMMISFFCDGITAFSTHLYGIKENASVLVQTSALWRRSYTYQKLHAISQERMQMKDKNGFNWLVCAVVCGKAEIVKALLTIGANPNAIHSKDKSPLLFQATIWNRIECMKLLIAAGANVDVPRERDGMTPLFYASYRGHMDAVELLIANNANPNVVSTQMNASAFFIAVQYGQFEIVRHLLGAGANVNAECTNASITPMYMAARRGFSRIVKLLIDNGATIDEPIKGQGDTPLYTAINAGYPEVVRVLLAAGANPNKHYISRDTPLTLAVKKGHYKIVELLLASALMQLQLRGNRLSYLARIAREHGYDDIEHLLQLKSTTVMREQLTFFAPSNDVVMEETRDACLKLRVSN